MSRPEPPAEGFSEAVRGCFSEGARLYPSRARLQAAVAQRLAGLTARQGVRFPPGPLADLGAGSGMLSRSLEKALGQGPWLRIDACSALLEQGAGENAALIHWDLNQGLPANLQQPAALASSFALQWLERPEQQLGTWCEQLQPGGWLILGVPTSGSFPLWHQAAAQAGVPCTALELPCAQRLIDCAQHRLQLHHAQVLRFSRPNRGGLWFLQQIKAIGAQASRSPKLNAGQLRRLLRAWPGPQQAIVWEVLVLLGQKR